MHASIIVGKNPSIQLITSKLVKFVAFALCHSQGFLCDESVASGAEQELALKRYAISHSGSFGGQRERLMEIKCTN